MHRLLLTTAVFSLILGQFSKIGVIGGSKIYLFDILVFAYVLYGIFYYLAVKKKFFIPRTLILFEFFTLIAGLSLIYKFGVLKSEELLIAGFYLARWTIYLHAGILTYNFVKDKMIPLQYLFKMFLFSGLFLAFVGFIQLIILPDFSELDPILGWDPHKNRLASTFFDPNFTGNYLNLIFVLFISRNLFLKKEIFTKKQIAAILVLLITAIFLTYSRSAWAMFGLIVLIHGWKHSKKLIYLSFLIAFLAYFAVPRIQTRIAGITDPADSARFRLISWSNTMQIAKDNLFLGVGFNAFKKAQIDYGFLTPDTVKEHNAAGSDSSLLLVLVTTGIIGFVIFTAGILFPAFDPRNHFYVIFLLPLIAQSQFINAIFYPQIMFLWLIVVGLKGEIISKS